MIKKILLLSFTLFSVSISANELNSGDTAWILTSTALVLFMTLPGLSLFYAGLVRSKNAISVLMQCFAIACIVSVAWVVYGYSLAFTEGNAFIGGLKSRALVRIGFNNGEPFEAERFGWSIRVREVEIDDDGAIWVLEDGSSGRLIKFTKPNK